MIHTIYPCLWFDNQAGEAADFYCSVFPNSKKLSTNPIVVKFELNGTLFMALNGNHNLGNEFNDSASYVVTCNTQEEIDHYWTKLTEGGRESMCGWLKDKFGVSWQIVPAILSELMNDPEKAPRVMNAFMKMKKFDIENHAGQP